MCDGREFVRWRPAEEGGGAEEPDGTSPLMDFHVTVFEMNQCFTLCDLHGCSRRDFESCVAGYISEYVQRMDRAIRYSGLCTALADDQLRGACEAMDGLFAELDGNAQPSPARRARAFSVTGMLIDELGGFVDRWRNLTLPAQMMTCIDAIEVGSAGR